MAAFVSNEKKNGCLVPTCNVIEKHDSNKSSFKATCLYKTHEGKLKHDKI